MRRQVSLCHPGYRVRDDDGLRLDGFGMLGFFLPAGAAIVLMAAWIILAGSRFVQGGVVERPERVSVRQDPVTRTLSLVLAVLVFAFHRRWLRRRNAGPTT